MSGSFADSPLARRTPLAIGLCILAMLFAVEAKTAWYGPFLGPGCAVRAAKALPMGLPELVDHGVPTPDPAHPRAAFPALQESTPAWPPRVEVAALGEMQRSHLLFFATYFSPTIFFRPPPAS